MSTTADSYADIARAFHALSDETRIRVLDALADGEMCVCDLQCCVGAAQSRLSFHLRVLREAGLVDDRKEGRWVYYSLRSEALQSLASYLLERKPDSSGWSSRTCGPGSDDACCS